MKNTEKTITGCNAPQNKSVGQGLAPAVKKLLSLALAITMLFSITAGIDLSAYAAINGDYEYSILNDGTVEITHYHGSASNLTIPSTIDGIEVTSIGDAFEGCTSLASITIPDSVINILYSAFEGCTSLTNVTIPNSVTIIGAAVFEGCTSLTNVTIPDSVTSLGSFTFKGCTSLASVTIPDSVTSIGSYEFQDCESLTSITIPNSVTSIGEYAFGNCKSLESITIPNSVTSIGNYAFRNCTSLASVTIQDGVTSIGVVTFCGCTSLMSVTIPNSVTRIGQEAFLDCTSLVDVYYNGSIMEWKKIKLGDDNECLSKSTIHCSDGIINCKHSYDAGKVTKKATCKATGVKTYTCTVCGETETETIAKTAHTYKTTTTKATTKKNGSKVTKCSVCGTKKSTTTIYSPKTITLSKTSYVYNGKAQKPSVTVKDSKGKKIAASNYTLKYTSNKNVGQATVTITFKGNYSGTVKKTFTIKPKATTLSSVTAKSKGFTAKWKKQATQTTGYQIQYSTSSKFSNAKTVTVSKNKTTSKSVSKLTAKKKYYVRIRTYKTVKVNGKSTKIYSAWSSAKSIKTK